ncbi:pathogenicity island protein [Staphylococcus aureus]|nr:pathogenicity island protein [Staphylococcus aureus]
MKRSLKQVVIKNCESMTQVADRLRDEYINVYHDDLNNYEQLKQELQEAENKLKAHNNEYYTKQRELSRYIDGKRRENDIQNIEFVGAVNIIEPFNV